METNLCTQVLLSRDLDQWNVTKDILQECEGFRRFTIIKILADSGCFSVVQILKPLSDSEFYNLIFDYME